MTKVDYLRPEEPSFTYSSPSDAVGSFKTCMDCGAEVKTVNYSTHAAWHKRLRLLMDYLLKKVDNSE